MGTVNKNALFDKIVATEARDVVAAVRTLRDNLIKGMFRYVVTAADVTAGSVTLDTGYGADPEGLLIVQIQRLAAGSYTDVTGDARIILNGDGTITIDDGAASYVLTAGDVINLIALP